MNDYRFRVDLGFYEILHNRITEILHRENINYRQRGGWFGVHSFSIPDRYNPAEIPSKQFLANIIDAAFWASLGKEEGRVNKFKISYKNNNNVFDNEVIFTQPLKYTFDSIVKLVPSCGDYGSLLVSPSSEGLSIVGRSASGSSFLQVKVIDPGQLVIKAGIGNIAAISGSEIVFIRDAWLGIYGEMWDKLGKWSTENGDPEVDTYRVILVNVARRMRQIGHGGAIIIVPDNNTWENCVSEITYKSSSQLGELRRVLNLQAEEIKNTGEKPIIYADYIESGIQDLAALTQVDGAVLLRRDLSLIGFGVKLTPRDENPMADIYEMDPLDHEDDQIFHKATTVGGTRHSSAARFIHDNPEALALVVSEDGIVSCFASKQIGGKESVVRYKRLELTLF